MIVADGYADRQQTTPERARLQIERSQADELPLLPGNEDAKCSGREGAPPRQQPVRRLERRRRDAAPPEHPPFSLQGGEGVRVFDMLPDRFHAAPATLRCSPAPARLSRS